MEPRLATKASVARSQRDDKLLCVSLGRDGGLSRAERLQVVAFFALYGRVKALARRLRGQPGPTCFQGIEG